MYKGIVNKIKYNKFLRNLTLSLGYKFPNLINWKKQLKNTDQFKDIKKINKEVLIAPVVTSDQILVSLHSILGFSLQVKGANVDYLTCNSSLSACTNAYNFAINNDEFIKNGPKQFCSSCYDCSYTLFAPLSSQILKLNKFIDENTLKEINKIVQTTKVKDIVAYKLNNINIGENTLAGTLRYFARGSLDFENRHHTEILKNILNLR